MKLNFFQTLPVKRKIGLLFMVITGSALILFSALSSLNQIRMLKKNMVSNLQVLAGAISHLSPSSLGDSDRRAAEALLAVLHEEQDIEVAAIYNLDDEVYAFYRNRQHAAAAVLPETIEPSGYRFVLDDGVFKLRLSHPIVANDKRIGTMYVVSNLNKFSKQFYNSTVVLLIIMGLIFVAAQFFSRKLQRLITRPVFSLAETARQISEIGDYSVRVKRTSRDEIGDLIDDFNTMLDAIEVRDSELHQHRHNLELLVEERTEELRTRRDEALAAAQAKTEFLANMSHEIRTPMNGVIGVLSLLKGAPLSDDYRRLLETASRSADSLMHIINDILDFSKIDAGMVEFESIGFDLRELMEETASLFIDTVTAKGIEIFCFVPRDVHCFVEGDPTRLRQVLTNLVNNAVKFTADGEVVLKVECIEVREKRQLLRFSVSDTGIGITESALPRLFEKFTQADGSTTRKYGGTGLGLSVCKQLVEMQGGDIGVSSSPNNGSEFWFTLSLGLAPAPGPVAGVDALDGTCVLLVDGNETSRMIIEHYLAEISVAVISCPSGTEALRHLAESGERGRRIDMVLMSGQLPDRDATRLAAKIRELYPGTGPELFMLGSGRMDADSAARFGISAVIYKPVRRNELYETLLHRTSAGLNMAGTGPESSAEPYLSGKVLLVDDEPINQKVARAILEHFGLETDLAVNGREAVERVKAVDYDIVLMDIQMPEMSGYEATELIRAQEAGEHRRPVTIIAMTANALESTKERCLAVGMNDFITKPIKPETLADRLSPWLGGERVEADGAERAGSAEEAGPPASGGIWARERALQFVGGDEGLLYDLIVLFLERKEKLLLAIEEAVGAGDPERLDDAAHAFKGAVNHFAAESVRQIALALEHKGKSGDMSGTGELLASLANLSDKLVDELSCAACGRD